jgi:PAS domain S-box-containing protein
MYRFASASCYELLGYTPDELVGTSPYEYFHPGDLPNVEKAHRKALRAEPYAVSYRTMHKEGHYIWVETTGRALPDEKGDVYEILCCTRRLGERAVQEAGDVHDILAERIDKILADESIEIVLQPIVALGTHKTCGYEALSRFPGADSPSPDVWFADAWRVGRGVDLELLAIRKALAVLPMLPADASLNVNVAPPVIGEPDFLAAIRGNESRIRVEITEHLQISDYEPLIASLAPFRAQGGEVVIDDFGAGYASLSHIIHVKPDWVKLDIALVDQVDTDPIVQAIVAASVGFAERADIGLVAEGIERQEQFDELLELNVKCGQGFLFARPAPPEQALAAH